MNCMVFKCPIQICSGRVRWNIRLSKGSQRLSQCFWECFQSVYDFFKLEAFNKTCRQLQVKLNFQLFSFISKFLEKKMQFSRWCSGFKVTFLKACFVQICKCQASTKYATEQSTLDGQEKICSCVSPGKAKADPQFCP